MSGASSGGAGTPTSKSAVGQDASNYSTAGGGQSEQDRLAALSMGTTPAAPAAPTPTKAAQPPTNYNATSSGGGQPEQQRLAALSNQASASAPPKPLAQTYDYSTPSYLQSYQVQVPGLPAVDQQPMMGGLSPALGSGVFK